MSRYLQEETQHSAGERERAVSVSDARPHFSYWFNFIRERILLWLRCLFRHETDMLNEPQVKVQVWGDSQTFYHHTAALWLSFYLSVLPSLLSVSDPLSKSPTYQHLYLPPHPHSFKSPFIPPPCKEPPLLPPPPPLTLLTTHTDCGAAAELEHYTRQKKIKIRNDHGLIESLCNIWHYTYMINYFTLFKSFL